MDNSVLNGFAGRRRGGKTPSIRPTKLTTNGRTSEKVIGDPPVPTVPPSRRIGFETIAAQAGGSREHGTGAVVPPVHVATTFVRDDSDPRGAKYCYGREDNATVHQVEDVLARLENTEAALLFASGMAAAAVTILSLPRPAHVVAPKSMYWGFKQWLARDAAALGVETTFVDMSDLDGLSAAMRSGRTRLVWIETPCNPLWTLTDIAEAARIAHAGGALLAVDSTVSTPVLTSPIALGADIVVHSATKYLNGHSDVVAGALCFADRRNAQFADIARMRSALGGVIGGHEAAMLLRGMRTLHLRVRHQSATALAIAQHFERHRAISRVLYPGLPSHPGHAIARKQMIGGFGGMLSMRLKGGKKAALATTTHLGVWLRATSLGGVESLVEHRASMEGDESPCPMDLLRLSVGIENVGDLIVDLEQALDRGLP